MLCFAGGSEKNFGLKHSREQLLGKPETAQETLEQVRPARLGRGHPGHQHARKKSGLDILDDLKRLRSNDAYSPSQHAPRANNLRDGALKSGAAGYLTKDSVTEELKEAVKKIVGGGEGM